MHKECTCACLFVFIIFGIIISFFDTNPKVVITHSTSASQASEGMIRNEVPGVMNADTTNGASRTGALVMETGQAKQATGGDRTDKQSRSRMTQTVRNAQQKLQHSFPRTSAVTTAQ